MSRSVVVLATLVAIVLLAGSSSAAATSVGHKTCGQGPKGTLYGKLYQVGELAAQARAERQKRINAINKANSGTSPTSALVSMLTSQAAVAADFVASMTGIDLGSGLFSSTQEKSTKPLDMLLAAERSAVFPSARIVVHSSCGCPVPVATTISAFDGTFELTNLPVGDYAVSVDGLDQYVYPAYRLEVSQDGSDDDEEEVNKEDTATKTKKNLPVTTTLSVNDGVPQRLQGGCTAKEPVVLRHIGRAEFFLPREEINPLSFLANPMVLMMLFSVVMMGLMKLVPKEEMRAQAKEMSQALEDGKTIMRGGKK